MTVKAPNFKLVSTSDEVVELNKIKSFETGLIEKIKSDKPELIDKIQSTGKLEEDTEKILMQTIEEYKKSL